MKVSLPAVFLLLLCVGLTPVPALFAAAPDGEPRNGFLPNNAAAQREQAEPRISRREASEIAQQSFPGKVISIQPVGAHWRVRVDQDGRVFDVFVDAETGRVTRPADGN